MSAINYSKWEHLQDYESSDSWDSEGDENDFGFDFDLPELDENGNPAGAGCGSKCRQCGHDFTMLTDGKPPANAAVGLASGDNQQNTKFSESLKSSYHHTRNRGGYSAFPDGDEHNPGRVKIRAAVPDPGPGPGPSRPLSTENLKQLQKFKEEAIKEDALLKKKGPGRHKRFMRRRKPKKISEETAKNPKFLAIPKRIRRRKACFRMGRHSRSVKEGLELVEWFKDDAFLYLEPRYVKLHPLDLPESLEPEFCMHPKHFVPRKDENEGFYKRWGIPMPTTEKGFQMLQNRMFAGNMYKMDPEYPKTPEQQFIDYLKTQKEKKLKKVTREFLKRDFILKIFMTDMKPEVWRRFKVSGAMNLNTLQDKVITPIMGWTRNYHGYMYTDQNDGTVYGPQDCNAIDIMCWKHMFAIDCFDDAKVPLGLVLQKEGDWLLYEYDLGDHWEHKIVVERILSVEESTGRCELLAGAMRCPPEDSHGLEGKGNEFYQDLLELLPPQRKWKGPRSQTLNYTAKRMMCDAETAMNVKPGRFDPYEFDIKKVRKNLKDCLTSRSSVRDGCKKMVMPVGASAPFPDTKTCAGEQLLVKDRPWGYMEEKASLRRDEIDLALCHGCGNPNNLKLCTGCRMVRYCSKACQKEDWKSGHNKECKNLQSQHTQVKAELIAEKKKKNKK